MSGSSHDDIERLIAEFQHSGLRELHVRHEGLEIYLSTDADAAHVDRAVTVQAAPTPSPAPAAPAVSAPAAPAPARPTAEAAPSALPPGATIVHAPYLGTFYRSPKPGSAAFVEIGQQVSEDTELCLVEVMKLFTAVRAGTAGIVDAVLAADGEMVTADQPLFVIRPA